MEYDTNVFQFWLSHWFQRWCVSFFTANKLITFFLNKCELTMTKFDHHPEIESYIEQKFGYLAHVALKMSLNNNILLHRLVDKSGNSSAWGQVIKIHQKIIRTSWHGTAFRITGPLSVETTSHRWISLTNTSNIEFIVFFYVSLNTLLNKPLIDIWEAGFMTSCFFYFLRQENIPCKTGW